MRKIILFVLFILGGFAIKAQPNDNIDMKNMYFLSQQINYLISFLNLKKIQLKEDSLILFSIEKEIYSRHSSNKKKVKEAKRYMCINFEMIRIKKEIDTCLILIKSSFKKYKSIKENVDVRDKISI